MSEEDYNVKTVMPVKSDMHSYSSSMTAKDVKALTFKHNIPLDLHPVALTAEWTMDKLPDDSIGSGGKILNETFSGLKGWKKRFFFLDRRAIPQAMAWRHHDSDIHDPLPTDGFRASDVVTLTNQSIDIRPIPSGLLFHAGLATTWEFSGFLPSFKDTEGNVVTMSEYLRFPFLDGATIEQGDVLSARDAITLHTTGPLPANQSLPEKTARLKEVEIPDPKIVAIRERKARAAAKKRAERKRAAGGEGGSKGKPKRRKVSVVRPEEEDSTEEASSASPLRTVAPNPSFLLRDVDEGTAESQEDEHVSVPNNDSANTNPDHTVEHDESFGESRGHGGDETRLTESPVPARNPEKIVAQDLVPLVRSNLAGDCADGAESSRPGSIYVPEWTIHWRSRVDTPGECRELLAHLAPPAVREEMNAYDNSTAMERAWFNDEDVRGEHAGCAKKLTVVERERDELRAVNADQVSQIKELEAELARKDSALVFSDRVSNERAVENEKLVSRLGYFEKEKIDSIGKLLPTVVRRLLNSHEYKGEIVSPFQCSHIQARGWAKGFSCEAVWTKDHMDVIEVEKIFGLPRQTVQELLKMYPAPPPPDAPTRVNPPSQAPDGSKSVPEGANVLIRFFLVRHVL
ncbi:hypothetical protein Tco_0356289 [Tanacetum coccineum]